MRMIDDRVLASLEAALFHFGEVVTVKKLGEILEVKEDIVKMALKDLQAEYTGNPKRGLMLFFDGEKAELVTKPELSLISQKIAKDDLREELTPAALETLSVIAYLGPLSRARIDYVRGVNSTFTLRSLQLRGLIERHESRKQGGFYEYAISFDFLKHLGVDSVQKLPDFEKYRAVLERMQPVSEVKKDG